MNEIPTLVPGDFEALAEPLGLSVRIGDNTLELPLAVESVRPLPPHRFRAAPFSLILRGPQAPLLAQGIYALDHPRHGRVELFLVPISRDASGARYEVTFN